MDQNPIGKVERINLLCNDASHFEDLVGVAPFVVVPGADFDEGLVELDTSFDVEDGGASIAAEVGGDDCFIGVTEDAFEFAFGSFLHSCDIFCNDAFGTAHRAHASTAVITKYISTSVAGFLLEKEIAYLGNAVEKPVRPFVAILGGAKVSDKLAVVNNLLTKVNTLIIGGGMAYTFLKAMGHNVGNSLCENDQLEYAADMIKKAKELGVDFLLPVDNVAADKFDAEANTQIVGQDIPEGWMGLDIGPKTVELYSNAIKSAKTVVWNGPMGCFEMEKFNKGTFGVCAAVAEVKANGGISIIGGGDSVAAVNKSGQAAKMSHISTGGGASLEYLEGKQLPGVVALNDK